MLHSRPIRLGACGGCAAGIYRITTKRKLYFKLLKLFKVRWKSFDPTSIIRYSPPQASWRQASASTQRATHPLHYKSRRCIQLRPGTLATAGSLGPRSPAIETTADEFPPCVRLQLQTACLRPIACASFHKPPRLCAVRRALPPSQQFVWRVRYYHNK